MNPRSKETVKKKSRSPRKNKLHPVTVPSFDLEIANYVTQVESLARVADQTMKVVTDALTESAKCLQNFMKAKSIGTTTEDGKVSYQLRPADARPFLDNLKSLTSSGIAVRQVPHIFFCSLVHQYDAYLGRLLRVAFHVIPGALNASQKQMTYSELLTFDSIDVARDFLVEKEIEDVIRLSHSDQFTWIEKRFGLPLRKDLPIWPVFIEMTERRNLFVHCDGVVSSQYLSVCKEHGATIDNSLRVGDQLQISEEYFGQAYACLLEIGVKLGHVLWRKIEPTKLKEAEKALHLTAYEILKDEKYSLAKTLLEFAAITLKKHATEEIRRMDVINLAIAHYYLGEKEEALRLIDEYDWSASLDKFKLAVAVLHEDYAGATKIMRRIGKKGEVNREAYSSWPLFRDFRQSKEFLSTYRKLFGKEFSVPGDQLGQQLDPNKTSQQVA